MHTEVHNAVTAADQGTQYDESAKRLLGQKSILAQILVRTVDEFKGMNPRYVENRELPKSAQKVLKIKEY